MRLEVRQMEIEVEVERQVLRMGWCVQKNVSMKLWGGEGGSYWKWWS